MTAAEDAEYPWHPKPLNLSGPQPLPWSPPREGTGVRVRCKVGDGFNEAGDEGVVMAWNAAVMRVYFDNGCTAVWSASQLEVIPTPGVCLSCGTANGHHAFHCKEVRR
jgi:hypothetical protein